MAGLKRHLLCRFLFESLNTVFSIANAVFGIAYIRAGFIHDGVNAIKAFGKLTPCLGNLFERPFPDRLGIVCPRFELFEAGVYISQIWIYQIQTRVYPV